MGGGLAFLLASLPGSLLTLKAQDIPAAPEALKPIQPPHMKAALIKLTGPVDGVMLASVQRRVDEARKAECDLIVYEIDTSGGLLTSAIDISQFNKNLDIPTVAYIHGVAYSAGAVVALSCDQIVLDPDGKLGDCDAIALTENENPNDSPLIKEMEDSARRHNYSPLLVRSMVVRGTPVFELRNNITGISKFVGTDERNILLHDMTTTPEGKSVTTWRLIDPPINKEGQILSINTAKEALHLGLAQAQVNNEQELLAVLNIHENLLPMDYSPSEVFERWLVEPGVRAVLFLLMLVLAYMEFSHPGTALPGIGALVCLGLLIGAPYMSGLAHGWEIVLILVGVIIIVADLVMYGGIGMLAVPGFILVAIGIVASFVPTEPGQPWIPQMSGTYVALQTGLSVVIFGTIVAVIIFFMLARYLHMTPGLRRLQLAPASAAAPAVVRDVMDRQAPEAVFVGALGKVIADLHPAGKAAFGDYLVDVITQGHFSAAGRVVAFIEFAGNNVIVKMQTTA